jgi:hypothetical protein
MKRCPYSEKAVMEPQHKLGKHQLFDLIIRASDTYHIKMAHAKLA